MDSAFRNLSQATLEVPKLRGKEEREYECRVRPVELGAGITT